MGIDSASLGKWIPRLHRSREVVRAGAAVNRPNYCQSVHDASLARQVLADPDAGHTGGNGTERTAHLTRGVGLRIPSIDVARASRKPNEDHRLAVRSPRGRRLGPAA